MAAWQAVPQETMIKLAVWQHIASIDPSAEEKHNRNNLSSIAQYINIRW